MKRLISIFILLFLVSNSFAKNADFFGAREVVAAKGGEQILYHYTSNEAAQNILKEGMTITEKRPLLFLTDKGTLTPLQAQIELALPANRSLPTSILRIDASGLEPLLVRRITGNLPGMGAGGGTEFLFNQNIHANLIQLLR